MRFREKVQRFMAGRYGADELSRVLLAAVMILLVLSVFVRWTPVYLLGLLLLVYCYYRMLSKNISKMYAQNQKYLTWRYKVLAKWNSRKVNREQRKIYRYFKCPQCKQKVRVPKGRGKICITCPKCKMEFLRKS